MSVIFAKYPFRDRKTSSHGSFLKPIADLNATSTFSVPLQTTPREMLENPSVRDVELRTSLDIQSRRSLSELSACPTCDTPRTDDSICRHNHGHRDSSFLISVALFNRDFDGRVGPPMVPFHSHRV